MTVVQPKEPTVEPVVQPTEPVVEPTEATIPKHRFDEVYGKMKTMQQELEAFKEQEALKAKESLEATQQYETLYKNTLTEHEALKVNATELQSKAAAYETVINNLVESKLSVIPTELHDLIPSNISTAEKLEWINKAEAKGLFKSGVVEVEIGKPTNTPHPVKDLSKMSTMEKLTNAFTKK